jgi:hypothetical protein
VLYQMKFFEVFEVLFARSGDYTRSALGLHLALGGKTFPPLVCVTQRKNHWEGCPVEKLGEGKAKVSLSPFVLRFRETSGARLSTLLLFLAMRPSTFVVLLLLLLASSFLLL